MGFPRVLHGSVVLQHAAPAVPSNLSTPAACRALGYDTSYPARDPGYWWQACSLRRCQLDQQVRRSVWRDAFGGPAQMPVHWALNR